MRGRTTRRALLAAAATFSATTPVAARSFLAGQPALRLGVNLERWFPIAADQRPRRLGRGWWAGLREAGFDHARLFIPKDAGAGDEVLRLFLTAIDDARAAGMPVLLGLADLYDANEPWDMGMWRQLATRARLFGRATDPASVALAPLNEPAFPDAESWAPRRDQMLALVRAEAPRHTLIWGGHEWCSWQSLLSQAPPPDRNTIAEVHDYVGGEAQWVAQRFGAVAAWSARHDVPVMVTELGGALPHAEDERAWAADLERALPELRRLGLPAALWAVTHGGHWRLQLGDGPALRPRLAAALRAARVR